MNIIALIAGTLVVSAAIYTAGYSQGKKSVKAVQFDTYMTLQNKITILDTDMLRVQSAQAETRDKEVIKYVTVYRERIKNPDIADAIRSSGLLAAYDASVSTPIK